MLFIENYDAKSLDRSSVSMIDKYNGRLSIVEILLTKLSTLVNSLLSLIRDIRNTLGQCKQAVINNLEQVKEVIDGNDISGTEGTIAAIESALAAGDEAISRAEATLEEIQQELDCNESTVLPETNDCGEIIVPAADCSESVACNVCNYSEGPVSCDLCVLGDCTVNMSCDEPSPFNDFTDFVPNCTFSTYFEPECGERSSYDADCNETYYYYPTEDLPDDCILNCIHTSPCSELSMPENCTYTCQDGNGCNYSGDDCTYGTICGQSEPCNQIEDCYEGFDINCGEPVSCNQIDCGEPCGETCHMTTEPEEREDDTEGCGDCGDCGNCGEGEGCGDWSEFCGE